MKTALLILCLTGLSHADPVTLTDLKGRSIEVTIVSRDESSVRVLQNGKTIQIRLADLNDASRKQAETTQIAKPAEETRCRLAVTTVGSGRQADKNWQTDYGSYDQDIYHYKGISAKVECSKGGGPASLVTQWIGSAVGTSAKGVVKVDRKQIILKPGENVMQGFEFIFIENDTKYAALGVRDRVGFKFSGWIVRLIDADGRVLEQQASATPLLSVPPTDPKDDPQF